MLGSAVEEIEHVVGRSSDVAQVTRMHGAFGDRQQAFDRCRSRRACRASDVSARRSVAVLRQSQASMVLRSERPEAGCASARSASCPSPNRRSAGSRPRRSSPLIGFRPGPIELAAPVNAYCRHPTAMVHRYAGASITNVERHPRSRPSPRPCSTSALVDRRLVAARTHHRPSDRRTTRLASRTLDDADGVYGDSRRAGLPALRALDRRAEPATAMGPARERVWRRSCYASSRVVPGDRPPSSARRRSRSGAASPAASTCCSPTTA